MSDNLFKAYTFDELCAEADRIEEERKQRRQWGRWRLDISTLELLFELRAGRTSYAIDLERMTTPAPMLDFIFQLAGKTWCTTQDTGDLVQAFVDIFDPQATLCSFGKVKTLDATAYLRRRYGEGRRQ